MNKNSLQDIIGSKNYALTNLNKNFTEVIMNANKVIPENLVVVCYWSHMGCDWSHFFNSGLSNTITTCTSQLFVRLRVI